jgi:ABC-type glycerol-3-phosphate transport system permease component
MPPAYLRADHGLAMNATVGILTCVWAWNDFILPLVVLSDPAARTIPLAQRWVISGVVRGSVK